MAESVRYSHAQTDLNGAFRSKWVFVILALVLALTKGALDVSVLDLYLVVAPRYLLLVAAILFAAGWMARRLVRRAS